MNINKQNKYVHLAAGNRTSLDVLADAGLLSDSVDQCLQMRSVGQHLAAQFGHQRRRQVRIVGNVGPSDLLIEFYF